MPDAAVVFVLIMADGSIDAPFKEIPVPLTVYCHPVAKSSETIASDITDRDVVVCVSWPDEKFGTPGPAPAGMAKTPAAITTYFNFDMAPTIGAASLSDA